MCFYPSQEHVLSKLKTINIVQSTINIAVNNIAVNNIAVNIIAVNNIPVNNIAVNIIAVNNIAVNNSTISPTSTAAFLFSMITLTCQILFIPVFIFYCKLLISTILYIYIYIYKAFPGN